MFLSMCAQGGVLFLPFISLSGKSELRFCLCVSRGGVLLLPFISLSRKGELRFLLWGSLN